MSDDKFDPHIPLDYETPVKKPLNFNPRVSNPFFWTVVIIGILAIGWVLSLRPVGYNDERSNQCASNLHQIGLAILLYQQDNGGANPESLDQLLNESIAPDVFVCPASKQTVATAPSGATTQETVKSLLSGGHISYIYLGKGLTDKTTPPNAVIAYEPLGNHDDGMHVLCGDGRAILLNVIKGKAVIAAAATTRPVLLP